MNKKEVESQTRKGFIHTEGNNKIFLSIFVTTFSGGFRIFLVCVCGEGGGATPKVGVLTYCFVIFLPKMHENEIIWTQGTSKAHPWIRQ